MTTLEISAATTTSATTSIAPTTSRHLVRTGAVAGVVAGGAATAVAAIAHAAGVSLAVGGQEIALAGFATVTFVCVAIGTAIAAVLARTVRRPERAFLTTTVVLTALSLVPDLLADAATGTKLTLMTTHVVAAVLAIPMLASRLAD
jgi:hypothetical protein